VRLIARYISGIFLKNFAVSLAAIATLYFFQAVLADLIDHEFAPAQILIYHLMNLPVMLVQLTAPASLIGTVLTLGGLNRSNELVACYSIGVGLQQIVGVVLSVVFMICCFSLVVQDRILPPLYRKSTLYYWHDMKKRADFFVDFKQDKIWYRAKNLIYNLRRFDRKTETIQGMSVYTCDDEQKRFYPCPLHSVQIS
jgi:lipopolysaccharide export system permease protein